MCMYYICYAYYIYICHIYNHASLCVLRNALDDFIIVPASPECVLTQAWMVQPTIHRCYMVQSLLLDYKPVQHVMLLNTVGNYNKKVSICVSKYSKHRTSTLKSQIIGIFQLHHNLRDHCCKCGLLLNQILSCGI